MFHSASAVSIKPGLKSNIKAGGALEPQNLLFRGCQAAYPPASFIKSPWKNCPQMCSPLSECLDVIVFQALRPDNFGRLHVCVNGCMKMVGTVLQKRHDCIMSVSAQISDKSHVTNLGFSRLALCAISYSYLQCFFIRDNNNIHICKDPMEGMVS